MRLTCECSRSIFETRRISDWRRKRLRRSEADEAEEEEEEEEEEEADGDVKGCKTDTAIE